MSNCHRFVKCPTAAVLLAGGRGTRLRYSRGRHPKCLVAVHPRVAIIDLVIAQLRELGVTTLLIAGERSNNTICSYIAAYWKSFRVYSIPEARSGTWNVLRHNLNKLPPQFLIANADTVYLTKPSPTRVAMSFPEGAAQIGLGTSWAGGRGNVILSDGFVHQYDKGGLASQFSDAGYHVVNNRKLQHFASDHSGMLEDGFLQALVKEPQPAWHSPVQYIDLGTEIALAAARNVMAESFDEIASSKCNAAAARALNLLRKGLADESITKCLQASEQVHESHYTRT